MEKFWITNKVNSNTAEIFLYGYIDPYDVSAGDFIKELRSLEKDFANINVRINSGGGSVFEGLAIYNAMQQSTAHIETWVDGLAASMASIIALAGKKCHMSKSAMIMTHKPSVGSYGNSDEHKKNAQLLDGLELTMTSIYASRTGKTNDECKNCFLNGKDNWFNAEEAKAANLVDDIYDNPAIEAPKEKADAKNVWNMYNRQKFAAVFTNQNFNQMDKKFLSPAAMTALNITDATEQSAVDAAIVAMAAKAANADNLQTQLTQANAKITTLESAGAEKEVTDMLAEALNKDKKITKETSDLFAVQYKGKPAELKAVLATFQPIGGIVKNLQTNGGGDLKKFEGKTWDQLDEAGLLPALKAADANAFFDKYKEEFEKPHPEDKRD